jgi:hypothetical protein
MSCINCAFIVRYHYECGQGHVMNALRSLYSLVVINQPKELITISTK